jgi:hypothetical protein
MQAAQAERMQQYQLQMQDAMLKHKQQSAKALEDANARAQMGDVTAMEQQNMEARARGETPERQRLVEMSSVLSGIPEGPARDAAREDFKRVEAEVRAGEQKKAALSIIDTSVADGHMDGEQAKARIEAGEEPEQIAKEASKIREDRVKANMAMEDSQEAIAQAQQILQTAPKGSKGARLAKSALTYFMDSPSSQQKPGGGAQMLKTVRDALIRGQDAEAEAAALEKLEKFKKDAEREPTAPMFFGLFGNEFGAGGPKGPDEPTPGTHKTLRGLKSGEIKGKGAQPAGDPDEMVIQELLKAGVPLTPENIMAAAGLREQSAGQ